jgi:hypothetical protein
VAVYWGLPTSDPLSMSRVSRVPADEGLTTTPHELALRGLCGDRRPWPVYSSIEFRTTSPGSTG